MKKAFLLIAAVILLVFSFTMVSCENNVYLPEGDTWAVRDMYFSSFSDAMAWLMSQTSGTGRDLAESDIPEDMTITLLRNVEEGGAGIVVPKSFTGELCINFNGHNYRFRKDLEHFFEFFGGVKIDVINGTSVIPEDSTSESKALIVDVNTVTVDDHLINDMRPVPQAVQIGANGTLVINSSSGQTDNMMVDGNFTIAAGGSLKINGGKVRMTDLNEIAEESGFVITGGSIINPDRINDLVEDAIVDGGHPENVQQEVYHELGDWVKTDPLVHYRTCSYCEEHFEEAEHTFTEWQEDENHNHYRDCTVCGRHETQDHFHTLEYHDAVDATCTASGNIEYWYCGVCGKYFSDADATTQITFDQTVVPKLGHVLEKIAKIEPTCLLDGHEEYYHCTRCDKNYYASTAEVEIASLVDLVIPAIHHAHKVEHPYKAATCIEDGNEQYWSCPDCGKYFSDEECEHEILDGAWTIHSPGAHDLTEHVYHAATCTEPGNNAYWSCAVCGNYFSDAGATTEIAENSWVIPETGHLWGEWTTTTEPTCTAAGERQRVCAHDASHKENETINPLGHKKIAHVAVEPTCTKQGNSAYWACDRCGRFFSDEACEHEIAENSWVIPETGHQWGEWIIDANPTCTEDGSKHRVCAHDSSHTEVEAIDSLGHVLVHHDAKAPTCTEDGNIEYWQCTRCGDYFLDEDGEDPTDAEGIVDPALGHDWIITDWVHGVIDDVHHHWHACSRCDAHGDEAECLETAVYEHDSEGHWQVCSVCETVLSDREEHIWGDEVKYDSELGLHYVECTVCGERLYDELAEVSIGDIVVRTGENPPMGAMTVTEESEGTMLRIRYVAEEGESITALRCRYFADGEWSSYIEQGADGSFVMSVTPGTEYRIVLEAETAEGRSEYIKVVTAVTN